MAAIPHLQYAETLIRSTIGDEMRNVHELLKEKETELARVSQEVDALRLVVRLLGENAVDASRLAAGLDKPQPSQAARLKVFP